MDRLSVPPSHSTFKPRVRIWVYPDVMTVLPRPRWGNNFFFSCLAVSVLLCQSFNSCASSSSGYGANGCQCFSEPLPINRLSLYSTIFINGTGVTVPLGSIKPVTHSFYFFNTIICILYQVLLRRKIASATY
jgi:hypothetical protein